jgi:Vps16, C-terminal region/Vps16, N-terminal region
MAELGPALDATKGASAQTRGWVALQDRFYRRTTLSEAPSWPLGARELAGALAAAAPDAGPIALIPDRGWGVAAGLLVCTASGVPIARRETLRPADAAPARAVTLGWTRADALVVVFEDATLVRVSLVPVASPPSSKSSSSSSDSEQPRAALDVGRPVLAVPPVERPERVYDAFVLHDGQVVVRGIDGVIFCTGDDDIPYRLHGTFRPHDPRRAGALASTSAVGRSTSLVARECAKGEDPDGDLSSADNSTVTLVATALNGSAHAADVEVAVIGPNGSLSAVNVNRVFPVETADVHKSIALSPDGKFVASVVTPATIVVRNLATLSEIVRVIIPQSLMPESSAVTSRDPGKMAWVGPDSVAVLYGTSLLLVGPRGHVAPVDLHTNDDVCLHLTTERDGLRLTSFECVEFVQLVPESVEAVLYREDSPAYKLFHAAAIRTVSATPRAASNYLPQSDYTGYNENEFNNHGGETWSSLMRYEAISELREKNLVSAAAQSCIEAACLVWDTTEQKLLLAAAAYGLRLRSLLGDKEPSLASLTLDLSSSTASQSRRLSIGRDELSVPMAIVILRVLNTARTRKAGVPLTKVQLDALGLKNLIARFSRFSLHNLALRMSAFGGISPNSALAAWAKACMVTAASDEEISDKVLSHFEWTHRMFELLGDDRQITRLPHISAAEAAFSAGRVQCAEVLLNREIYPALKVPLYLKMGKEALALASAVASNDNEVLMDAMQHLLGVKPIREMARLFKSLPLTTSHRLTDLLVAHLKQLQEHEDVRVLLTEVGRHREAALELVAEADMVSDYKTRITALEKAAHAIGRGHHRRSTVFELQAIQHAILVSYDAVDLEKRCELEPGALRGASSTKLLAVAAGVRDPGRRRDALMRLRRDLKIPEQRFFWVVLEALATAEDLAAVEALSNSAGHGRPPPIGLMAFVDVCLRHGHETEATKYALRIADLRDRARALARCGRGKEAADIASKLRSQQLLEEVEALVARHMSQIHLSPHGPSKATGE